MNIRQYFIALAILLIVTPLSHAQKNGESCNWWGRDVYPICAKKQMGWSRENGQKCISKNECLTGQPSNQGVIIGTKSASQAGSNSKRVSKVILPAAPINGLSNNTDQCNTTRQCQAIYGNSATDCKNSKSNESICICGSARCDKKTPKASDKQENGSVVKPLEKKSSKTNQAKQTQPEKNKAAKGNAKKETVLLEAGGLVAIESESYSSIDNKGFKAKWRLTAKGNIPDVNPDPDPEHTEGASGGKYLEVLPDTRVTHSDKIILTGDSVNLFTKGGAGPVINYRVFFNTPGIYHVWLRAYSTGSEDNGAHVGINGSWPESGERVQWCTGKQRWTWSSAQRVNSNHCGTPKTIKVNVPSKGIHTISVSMREDGFELDKIILSKSALFEPSGESIKQKFYTPK